MSLLLVRYCFSVMVRPGRFERPAYSSGGCRSIQLSYGRGYSILFVLRRCRSRFASLHGIPACHTCCQMAGRLKITTTHRSGSWVILEATGAGRALFVVRCCRSRPEYGWDSPNGDSPLPSQDVIMLASAKDSDIAAMEMYGADTTPAEPNRREKIRKKLRRGKDDSPSRVKFLGRKHRIAMKEFKFSPAVCLARHLPGKAAETHS